ncbi:MAG: hypothetical protein QM820_13170 [Minicystis sp.]
MRTPLGGLALTLLASTLAATSFVACGGGSGGTGGSPTTASSTGSTGGSGGEGTTSSSSGDGGGTTSSSSASSGSGGAGTGGSGTGGGMPVPCGIYEGFQFFNCSPDGTGRGKCDNGTLVYETCD